MTEQPSAVDARQLRTLALYALVPALVGTAVYWYVTDATLIETVIFTVIMVVMILAMDYFFDTIPVE